MTSANKIYPFAQPAVPPAILDDADYAASSITTTTGYVEDTEADAPYMSKAQRQTSAMAAALGQFIANNQAGTTDVTDDLAPSILAAMLLDAISNAPLTTQPQFDNSTKAATTAFVQRALGSFAGVKTYGTNTALTAADAGCLILPAGAGIGFSLPLSSSFPTGTKFYFNGNGHGCAITKTGGDVINNGINGAISSISLLEQDSGTLVSVNGGWGVIDGELHQGVSSSFANSLVTDGYQYLPGGRIEQWGQATVAFNSGTGTTTITLPTPWPNGLLNGQVSFSGNIPPTALANATIEADPAFPTTKILIYGYSTITLSEQMFYKVTGY